MLSKLSFTLFKWCSSLPSSINSVPHVLLLCSPFHMSENKAFIHPTAVRFRELRYRLFCNSSWCCGHISAVSLPWLCYQTPRHVMLYWYVLTGERQSIATDNDRCHEGFIACASSSQTRKKMFMKWMKRLTGREDGEFSFDRLHHSVSVWQGLRAVFTNRCDSRIILFIQQPTEYCNVKPLFCCLISLE